MGVHYHKPVEPEADITPAHDFPDVGESVHSWAHDFDFPYSKVPQEPPECDCTHEALKAVFSQPRRSG